MEQKRKTTSTQALVIAIIVSLICLASFIYAIIISDNIAPFVGCGVAMVYSCSVLFSRYAQLKKEEENQ